MKSKNKKIKGISTMHELKLIKQKLEYKEKLYEKEVAEVSADIVDNLTDKLKEFVFNVGSRLIFQLFKSGKESSGKSET